MDHAEFVAYQRPRVFPSLCDWLDDEVSLNWLADFLALIQLTPNLDWLLLTKRPEKWRERIDAAAVASTPFHQRWLVDWLRGKPPENVWFGVSVEDQKRADERIPELREIPAVVRWLSMEPLLGPVRIHEMTTGFPMHIRRDGSGVGAPTWLQWIVVGGESGPQARPCSVEWIRSIILQGRQAGVPVFVKQIGNRPIAKESELWRSHGEPDDWKPGTSVVPMKIHDSKGGDPSEWPEDLRVRQFPNTQASDATHE